MRDAFRAGAGASRSLVIDVESRLASLLHLALDLCREPGILRLDAFDLLLDDLADALVVHGDVLRGGGCGCRGLVRKGVEDLLLATDDLEDALVDRVLAEEAEGEHAACLAHAVRARDGLVLDRGLVLRLAEDDDARALDVHARSARLDLGH